MFTCLQASVFHRPSPLESKWMHCRLRTGDKTGVQYLIPHAIGSASASVSLSVLVFVCSNADCDSDKSWYRLSLKRKIGNLLSHGRLRMYNPSQHVFKGSPINPEAGRWNIDPGHGKSLKTARTCAEQSPGRTRTRESAARQSTHGM